MTQQMQQQSQFQVLTDMAVRRVLPLVLGFLIAFLAVYNSERVNGLTENKKLAVSTLAGLITGVVMLVLVNIVL